MLDLLRIALPSLVVLCSLASPGRAEEPPPQADLWEFGAATERAASGTSLSLSGEVLALGVPGDATAGRGAGRVDLYRHEAGAWRREATLRPSQLAPGDAFGQDLALQGDRLVVGAPGSDRGAPDAGAVFLFERREGVWREVGLRQLTPRRAGDRAGWCVDLDGEDYAFGAPGRDDTAPNSGRISVGRWDASSVEALAIPDARAGEGWGHDLDLQGDRLLVGAPWSDRAASAAGAVASFHRIGDRWRHERTWTSPTPRAVGGFGYGVAIGPAGFAVGAVYEDGVAPESGVVHFWSPSGGPLGSWAAELGRSGEVLGAAVAPADAGWIVGAPLTEAGGEAFELARTAGEWRAVARYRPRAVQAGDRAGIALAVGPGRVVLGAPGSDRSARGSGRVFVFARKALAVAVPASSPGAGGALEIAAAPLDAASVAAFVAVEWDSAPLFRIVALRRVPSGGRVSLATTLPPALIGHQLGVQALGRVDAALQLSPTGRLRFD